jgi:phosphoserine phosphatase RsbU/P
MSTNSNPIVDDDNINWQSELAKSSDKYHIYGSWIAVFFDPLFGLTDYFNIPYAWKQVIFIRIAIALLTLALLLVRMKYKFSSRILIFVPFFLISIQNAYTFSLIKPEDFTGHSLNYMALLIGGGMFIMWPWYYSLATIIPSVIANFIFISLNGQFNLEQALVNGGLLLIVVAFFMFLLIETRFQLTISNIKSKLALVDANEALSIQKTIIEHKNKDITDSISYAQRIQNAMLPLEERMLKLIPNHFILFRPLDIVSGDFYWFAEKEERIILGAIDCTGHGVPGALMSMVGDSVLNRIVHDREIHHTDLILNELHVGIRQALHQDRTENRDGMDAALLSIDLKNQIVEFSGAKNPLICIQNNVLYQIKGDKMPIGGEQREKERIFKKHTILCDIPTYFYIFSDGYQDQFGGPEGRKFMSARFRNLLLEIHQKDMQEQKEILDQTMKDWLGSNRQIDDILVIGLKIEI